MLQRAAKPICHNSLPALLRALRERKRWSQKRLAAASGYTAGYVAQIESGLANVPPSTLLDLLSALGYQPVMVTDQTGLAGFQPLDLTHVRRQPCDD